MAEVNDKGEVTVEGEFVGKLEGFRFRADASASPDEARVVLQAAVQALKPEFHLRADRFYNAPDTELDFTEQGGLMWGSNAIGKLIKGAETARPGVEPFVDEEAGPDVVEKVRRRLQHFIDRKVAAQFEPLLAMSRDEALTGLARGFAFRLVEGLGVLARDAVNDDVKALDQEARGVLRKHGVRFGQFTIFLPALLKPAPTRLRLVLWSLFNGLQEFPESPPPGLVTIPNIPDVPKSHYTLAGYHPAGSRAIRIDMLERLADILRARDSRAGFEASGDMLSITGMTLDQFAGLMAGLGYKGEKGERAKVKAAPAKVEPAAPVIIEGEFVSVLVEPEPVEEPAAPDDTEAPAPEMETFYTFIWAPRPREREPRPARPARTDRGGNNRNRDAKPAEAVAGDAVAAPTDAAKDAPKEAGRERRNDRGDRGGYKGSNPKGGKPQDRGGKPNDRNDRGGKDKLPTQNKPFEARPPRYEKPIDPDNPFAVLMALRNKT